MREISVLQIADENWQEQYDIPSNIRWTFVKPEDIVSLLPTDIEMLEPDSQRFMTLYWWIRQIISNTSLSWIS